MDQDSLKAHSKLQLSRGEFISVNSTHGQAAENDEAIIYFASFQTYGQITMLY